MRKILTYQEFVVEKYNAVHENTQLILEGGAAGHMSHPFDNNNLTFGDFKTLIDACLRGELNFEEEPTEKTDGQNLWATIQDGEVKFARNTGETMNPMDLGQFKNKFEGHASQMVQATFQLAAQDLADLLIKLPKDKQEQYFQNGKNFMNMELIYSQNPNVIHYDVDAIQFHGIIETDGQGNKTGDQPNSGSELAKILKDVNANIGKTFTVIPPQIVKLGKDVYFDINKAKFIKKLEVLQNKYALSDGDPVSKYHEMWWREQIDDTFPAAPQNVKDGLMLRWAFEDKKTLNMRSLEKEGLSKEQADAVKKFDKEDAKKKWKENIRPFEDLFLELGSIVLKNASNFVAANPSEEAQRLQSELRREADKVKANGDLSQIDKVESELSRLERIGGLESILPTEGIVFRYKGHTYKLTGTFAALNQLMGLIKYAR